MRRHLFLTLILVIPQPLWLFSQSISEEGGVRIYQDTHEISERDGLFRIQDKAFEIVVEGIDEDDSVAIFAYHSDEMFDRYHYPVSTSDTVLFAPGTGLAMPPNEDRKFFLRINKEQTQNYFSSHRRINKTNHAVIQIKGIIDPYDQFSGKDTAYLSLFVDSNKNRMIDEYEIRNLVLKIMPAVKKSSKSHSN